MKRLRLALIALAGLVLLAGIVGLFLPRDVAVERTAKIDVPPQALYPMLSSLRTFTRWSPWTARDPEMAFTLDGPDSGVGQKLGWTSGKLGDGSMQIMEAVRGERVAMHIMFGDAGEGDSILRVRPVDGGSEVTWSFATDLGMNPFAHYASLVMPRIIGKEYETGLANLKAYAEAVPPVDTSALNVARVAVAPKSLLVMRVESENAPEDVANAVSDAFAALGTLAAEKGIAADGAPLAIATGFDETRLVIDAAVPVSAGPDAAGLPEGVSAREIEEGNALRLVHRGAYGALGASYTALLSYALVNGYKVTGPSWNEYVVTGVPESELETHIYLPVE